MRTFVVGKIYKYWTVLVLCGLLAGSASAVDITLHLKNDQVISGEIVDMGENGIKLKLPDGTYMANPVPWGSLSQEDLIALRQLPKAAAYAEPFIEIPKEEKVKKSEVELKPVPRLERPQPHSLIGAVATSSVGAVMLLVLYLANLYAAYEIAVYRGHSPGLVCGVSAVAPVIGPVIFLAMPHTERQADDLSEVFIEEGMQPVAAAPTVIQAPASAAVPGRPPTQNVATAPQRAVKSFPRGQFTFNRRFFETNMSAYFGVVRPEAEKDMMLIIKSARGTHVAQRISRISPNELYLQIQKGHASEEVIVPFGEIQEVVLKPKDA